MTMRWIDLSEFPGASLSFTGPPLIGESGTIQIVGTTLVFTDASVDTESNLVAAFVAATDPAGRLASLENQPRRVTATGVTATIEDGRQLTIECSGEAQYYGSTTGANRDVAPVFNDGGGATDVYDANDVWEYYYGEGFYAPHDNHFGLQASDVGAITATLTYQVYADDSVLLSDEEYTSSTVAFTDTAQSSLHVSSACTDTALAADTTFSYITSVIADVIQASDGTASRARLRCATADVASLSSLAHSSGALVNQIVDGILSDGALDAQRVATLSATDSVSLMDQIAAVREHIADLVDAVALSSLAGSRLHASAVVASALAAADVVRFGFTEELTDTTAFNEALSAALDVTTAAVDAAVFTELLAGQLELHFAVGDAVSIGESAGTRAQLLSTLLDRGVFTAALRLAGETIYGYVCNAETKAFTSYANYPFNSFAKIGHDYYGVADDGLYLLDGDNDGGEPIEASIRTALTTLGTSKMKRMPSVYLGMSAGGQMVLKAITTSHDGSKREDWYILEERPAAAVRETRVKIGRGLKSVYWGFELVNVDGADFALDAMQLFPMILERRL